jgi:hypothetical protein
MAAPTPPASISDPTVYPVFGGLTGALVRAGGHVLTIRLSRLGRTSQVFLVLDPSVILHVGQIGIIASTLQ